VLLDLGFQDVQEATRAVQAMLSRPKPLDVSIVTIGEERPFGMLIDGQKDVRRVSGEN